MTNVRKVIISCAVTGSIHTPSMSPYIPITTDEIANAAIDASAAGAAIVHLHARDPATGQPSPDPKLFMEFLPKIKDGCDSVLNISTGGSSAMSLEDRLAGALMAKPEMASLNMGSMNFGFYPLLKKYTNFKFDWERQHLENSREVIFKNTFSDIEKIIRKLGDGYGTRFEFECYDVGHLYSLAHFLDRGMVKQPLFIQTIFGVLGGIGSDPENLTHMRCIADKLFGDDYVWSVMAVGRAQMEFAEIGASLGSQVRVGLEDSIYISKGELASSNAQQVAKIRKILESQSLQIATPEEARKMLSLKGSNATAF